MNTLCKMDLDEKLFFVNLYISAIIFVIFMPGLFTFMSVIDGYSLYHCCYTSEDSPHKILCSCEIYLNCVDIWENSTAGGIGFKTVQLPLRAMNVLDALPLSHVTGLKVEKLYLRGPCWEITAPPPQRSAAHTIIVLFLLLSQSWWEKLGKILFVAQFAMKFGQ